MTTKRTIRLASHRSPGSPSGVSGTHGRVTTLASRRSPAEPQLTRAEITDIIPFNEFGDLAEVEFRANSAFDRETQVMQAPELCDLNDRDEEVPLRLAIPSEFLPDPQDQARSTASRESRSSTHAYRDSHTDVSDGTAATDIIAIAGRRGTHRKPDATAIRGRLMIAARAAGATAAGAHSLINTDDTASAETVLA